MNLKITSQVYITIGTQATNLVGDINAHTDTLLTTGIVQCDLLFWISTDIRTKKFNSVIPCTLDGDGKILKMASNVSVSLTAEEAAAANLPNTIYTKAAAALNSIFGWTVIVEA